MFILIFHIVYFILTTVLSCHQRSQYGVIEGDFAMAMSLYHGYELLQLHGLRSLYTFLDSITNGEKSLNRTRTELLKNVDFIQIMEILQKKFKPQ